MPGPFVTRRADELVDAEPGDIQPRRDRVAILVGILGALVLVEFIVGLVVLA